MILDYILPDNQEQPIPLRLHHHQYNNPNDNTDDYPGKRWVHRRFGTHTYNDDFATPVFSENDTGIYEGPDAVFEIQTFLLNCYAVNYYCSKIRVLFLQPFAQLGRLCYRTAVRIVSPGGPFHASSPDQASTHIEPSGWHHAAVLLRYLSTITLPID